MQPRQSVTTPQEEPGVATGTGSDNGSGRSRPHRPRRPKKEEQDEFLVSVDGPPAQVDDGRYQVLVKKLERWEFHRGRKNERQMKLTFWCTIATEGKHFGKELPLRMNLDLPIRRHSNLWKTICVAVGDKPKRVSRLSLKRLFVGRIFNAEVRTLISPERDANWKPVTDQRGNPVEKERSSIIDHFISAETGPPNDYLL
jgi:hypothetical protein